MVGRPLVYALGDAGFTHVCRKDTLKRRVEEMASRKQAGDVRFVEVRGADLMDVTSHDGAVVELHAANGTRMTVRLGSGAQVDLQALVASFRRHMG
jgi:hypothetical protein